MKVRDDGLLNVCKLVRVEWKLFEFLGEAHNGIVCFWKTWGEGGSLALFGKWCIEICCKTKMLLKRVRRGSTTTWKEIFLPLSEYYIVL